MCTVITDNSKNEAFANLDIDFIWPFYKTKINIKACEINCMY